MREIGNFGLEAVLKGCDLPKGSDWTSVGEGVWARKSVHDRLEFKEEDCSPLSLNQTAKLLKGSLKVFSGLEPTAENVKLGSLLLHQGIITEIDAEIIGELQPNRGFSMPPSCEFAILDEFASLAE